MRKKQNFFIWVVFLFFILGLSIFTPFSSKIKESAFFLLSPLQKTFLEKGNIFSQYMEIFQNAKDIRNEIEYLRKENRSLFSKISKLSSLREENQVLRDALDVDFFLEKEAIFGEVTGRDFSHGEVIIHHAKAPNEGDIALTSEGVFVGFVSQVFENFSKIELINKEGSSIESVVQNKENPRGVLRGTGGKNLLLDMLPKDKEIKKGDIVAALPEGGGASEAVYVGRVANVEKSDVEAFVRANVWHSIDYKYLDHLFILKLESFNDK